MTDCNPPSAYQEPSDQTSTYWRCMFGLWLRDRRLMMRSPAQSLFGVQLFVLICLFLPVSISVDGQLLLEAGNSVIWIAVLLASLLGVNSLLRQDFSDGGCHALLCSPCPLPLLSLTKIVIHWLVVCLPIVALAPVVGWSYGFSAHTILCLVAALLLTTPVVSATAMLAVIFSVGIRGGDLLAAAIAIPFFLPVAVVGADATAHAQWQREVWPHFYFMLGLLLLTVTLAPLAIATALRLSYEKS